MLCAFLNMDNTEQDDFLHVTGLSDTSMSFFVRFRLNSHNALLGCEKRNTEATVKPPHD